MNLFEETRFELGLLLEYFKSISINLYFHLPAAIAKIANIATIFKLHGGLEGPNMGIILIIMFTLYQLTSLLTGRLKSEALSATPLLYYIYARCFPLSR